VSSGPGSEEVGRSAELIERLLASPGLRRRFRADPGAVLREHGLGELAAGLDEGRGALMTLELRESRSSLAGVMVAAAAEGIEFGHMLEHAAPALGRQAGRAMEQLVEKPRPAHHPAPPRPSGGEKTPATSRQPAPAPPASRIPDLAPRRAEAAGGSAAAPRAGAPSPARQISGQPHPRAHPRPRPAAYGGSVHGRPEHGGPAELPLAGPGAHDSALDYPGDSATQQQLAAWMGAHARRAGLPPELPVMAALTESNLHNLSYGDRDSVGFFQMRVGIWDRGAYAGYPHHPELQIQWFIDHALAARTADPALAESPGTWGEWIADIERPAVAYRGRYQLQLASAQELLHGAALPAPAPAPVAVEQVPVGRAAVKAAMQYLAHRVGPASDGSGLVQYAYGRAGIQLPGVAAELFDVGLPVARHALRPGDVVFFAAPGGGRHVGLYIGGERFVSIPRAGGHARVSALADPPGAGEYVGARRYTAASLSDPSRFARTLPAVSR
jgi:hypothetical protein